MQRLDQNRPSVTEVWEPFFAGFDLGGWRMSDGTLCSCGGDLKPSNLTLSEWPEEITIFGRTYTLERVEKGTFRDSAQWENAIYV